MNARYGVRYLHPDGPLIAVKGGIEAADHVSAHAACHTWVVRVVVEHVGNGYQVRQDGDPVGEHESREPWTVPAPPVSEPATAPDGCEPEVRPYRPPTRDRRRPGTIAALLAFAEGSPPDSPKFRTILRKRGWTDSAGQHLTETGRSAVAYYRARQSTGDRLVSA